ncbi:CBO0543 family protein [Tuberibacillus calidus]|jgi:hypothetical protein|uniref:CBO0543 family protein n=1 Tax=Tuberibacillus calidus TaxID=340097 RepID=UPI000686039A|nr:CBO0543 family protein [Tuberibacillus calidus]
MPYLFIFISAVTLYTFVFMVPKQLSKAEMVHTTYFAILFDTLMDVFLDLHLDLYGYFQKGVDYQTLLVVIGIFPPMNILYLNNFPYGQSLWAKGRYLLIWSVIAIFYEYLAVKCDLLYYRKWSIFYSGLCYPPILIIAALNLKLLRYLSGIRN